MKLVSQPAGTGNCGQAVLAMLAGVSIEAIIRCIGEGRSPIEKMNRGAKAFGLSLEHIGQIASENDLPNHPGAVLLEIKTDKGRLFAHWIAWSGRSFFDPKFGERQTLQRTSAETTFSAEFYACDRDDSYWPANKTD